MSSTLQVKGEEIAAQVANNITNLKSKISMLRTKLREEQDIAQKAAAHGDRSENAEWQIANDNIARLMVSITTLSNTLEVYERYKSAYKHTGRVMLGSTLKVIDRKHNATLYVKIYPEGLGNAKIGAISVASPLGAAVIGKSAGTEVIVKAPIADIPYYIEEVL